MRQTRRQYQDGLRYRPPKVTFAEAMEKLRREAKRKMIADGVVVDPAKRPPRFMYVWENGGPDQIIYANDTGTARNLIKKALGLRKKDCLPPCVTITRFDNPARKEKEEKAS